MGSISETRPNGLEPMVSTQLTSPSLGEGRVPTSRDEGRVVDKRHGTGSGRHANKNYSPPRNPPSADFDPPKGRVRLWSPTWVDTNGLEPVDERFEN